MSGTWWIDPGELNEEQEPIINLPIGKSYLIKGPPGSGKTNLVLLRANYLHLSGAQNIEVVVFTRTLQEFIASGGGQYDFPVDKVKTSKKFYLDLLRRYDVHIKLPTEFKAMREYLIEETRKLVDKKNLANLFEAVLLDEGHSFLPEEIDLLSRLGKTMFIAADARQKIYTGEDCSQNMSDAVDQEYQLQFHYRIGRQICKVADFLMNDSPDYQPMLESSQYDEVTMPSRVEPAQRFHSIAEQANKIVESLRSQVKTYQGEFLGVLCPVKKDVLNPIRKAIEASDLADVSVCQGDSDAVEFIPGKRIIVCTIHAAQGVEFRTVHIAGADKLKKLDQERNVTFTAVTRAKTNLSIYYTGSLRGYFEQALQAAQPPKAPAKLSDVFGGKKKP
ncbi:MAG TPA: ATP-binding domain-containing protein [Terriglobales bacterium]|nr:ATP-binding domain-containing protein [Terriglobales bacterium]